MKTNAAGAAVVDINLAKSELVVRHTLARIGGKLVLTAPKTARSRRRVPLHAGVVAQLRAHRKQQIQERLQTGDQWTDTSAVFATEFGTMVDPRNLLRTVEIAARKAGIEAVGAHSLRHSAAVAWLESGCISRRRPICSGTPPSLSPATCTGIPATTPPAQRSTVWVRLSARKNPGLGTQFGYGTENGDSRTSKMGPDLRYPRQDSNLRPQD